MTWQLRAGAALGMASVGAGAYGAHAPSLNASDPQWKPVWSTAVQYHQLGALSLMACHAHPSARARLVGGAALLGGTALFSGTNYAVAYLQSREVAKGAPAGGMLMMLGFAALAVL